MSSGGEVWVVRRQQLYAVPRKCWPRVAESKIMLAKMLMNYHLALN